MGKSWRLPDPVTRILLVAGLAAIWIAFAPAKIGGQVSYVMVNGNSMEPGFHKGDLAIVRQAQEYQVGDIVTYHNAEMGADVIHRIISLEGDHFIIKGDNNSWVDAYHPAQDEIVGKLWLHIPKLGTGVEWIKSPVNMALAAGLLGGIFMLDMTPKKSKKNRKQKDKAAGGSGGMLEMALYASGFLALVFGGLFIFAFTRPLANSAEKIKYTQSGVFSYTAADTPGIYDSAALSSGEPVFTKLTCTLDLAFAYSLAGPQPENIAGSQQMDALLSDEASGWQKTIPLQPAAAFSGGAYAAHASLDLCQVQALVASIEKQTGFHLNANTLTIAAHSSIAGQLAGQDLKDTFAPRLVFKFDAAHFYLVRGAAGADPLTVTQSGALPNPALVENTLALPGLQLSVQTVRWIAMAGLALSLAGLGAAGWKFSTALARSPAYSIRMKYGSLLVNVVDRDLGLATPLIDVASIDDLARMAERQGLNILHVAPLANRPVHSYFVQNNGTLFRFVTSDTRQNASDAPKNGEAARVKAAIVVTSMRISVQTRLSQAYASLIAVWQKLRAAPWFLKLFPKKAAPTPDSPVETPPAAL